MALQQIANTDISSTGTFALGSISSSTLTSGRVTYATTGGLLTDSSSLTFNGSTLTASSLSGGNITNSGLTSGRITYASTGGLLVDSANLTFSGTTLTANTIGAFTLGGTVAGGGNQINNVIIGSSTPLAGSFTSVNATSITNSGLTSGRVIFANTSGLLSDSSNLAWNGTTLGVIGTAPNQVNFSTTAIGSDLFRIQPQASGTGVYLQTTDYNQTAYAPMGFYATSYAFNVGNVGVGVAPGGSTKLSVTATSGSLSTFQQTGATGYGLTIIPGADTTYDAFTINNAANTLNQIRMFGNGNATFAGSVGIGTSSPNAKLQVTTSSFPVLKVADELGGGAIALGDAAISSNYVGIWRGAANSISGGGFLNVQGNNIAFMSTDAVFGSATRTMTLTNTGNLGVGVTSPAARLDVTTSTAGFAAILTNTNGASDSNGLNIRSGTVSTEYNLRLSNTSNTADFMVVKGNGNVGIGTSTPSAKLDVRDDSSSTTAMVGVKVFNGNTTTNSQSGIGFFNYDNFSAKIYSPRSGSSTGSLVFSTNDGSGITESTVLERMRIDSAGNVKVNSGTQYVQLEPGGSIRGVHSNGGGGDSLIGAITGVSNGYQVSVTTGNAQTYKWHNGGTQSMTLDSSGNVLIGTTTIVDTYSALLVLQAAYPKTRMEIRNDGETSALYAITFRNGNGLIGNITTTGSTTAFNTSSDYRLKRDVQPMTGALAKVIALKPVTYKWKADGSDGQGFIAHELAEVCADAVTGVKDEVNDDGSIKPQGIDSSFLVATLTAAIQEQQALIESMATKLKDAGVAGF